MELSDFPSSSNLVALFLTRAGELGDSPFLWCKIAGEWQSLSWREAASQVRRMALALAGLGLARGDRVMLVSENRPEWCIADLAIMAAGCITVPAYITNTERDHAHVLDNSGARGVIVSTAKLARPLLGAMLGAGQIEHVIGIEPLGLEQAGAYSVHDWQSLLTKPAPDTAALDTQIATIARTDTACLIYTSGTGGAPRGVMQPHGAILHNVAGCVDALAGDFGWDRSGADPYVFLSFLPLSHAYEHTGGQFLPIGMGGQIWYAEGLDKLAANIEEVRPTVMIVVPRLFEVLRARIIKQIEKQGRLPAWLMTHAVEMAGRPKRLVDKPLDFLLEKLLRPKVRARFGGRVKVLVSGGAPLNPDVGNFFSAMGLTLVQGYGQTESGPIACFNRPAAGIRMDTVGPPLKDTQVRIADDGEILIRGELVMRGYWRNDTETAKVLVADPAEPDQGPWLHTGDIGHFDAAGRLVITDRKKDMIVNDKGDNISPQKLEGMLTLQPAIAQAMVVGDRRPYIVALIVPDGEWLAHWAASNGHDADLAVLKTLPEFRAALRVALDRVNEDLSVVEKIRQFAFADEPFAIDNEEMTPSLKIRRHKLKVRYGERLDALYKG